MSPEFFRYKNDDTVLVRIMRCNETWVLYNSVRRSSQRLDRNQAPQHLPRPELLPKKVLANFWWSVGGGIYNSFLHPRETITAEKYYQQISKFTRRSNVCARGWSIWSDQFSSIATNGRTSHSWPWWDWTNWATRLILIQRTHRTCSPLTTIFQKSRQLPPRKMLPKQEMMTRDPSIISWPLERRASPEAA